EVGAVNCIKVNGNSLKGFNTDITGFEKSITPLLKDFQRKALILGTGGASKSVQYVLKKLGIDYQLVSRNRDTGNLLHYSAIDKMILSEHLVIINTTPVGMHPDVDSLPDLPYQHLTSRHLLYDLVYNPAQTKFLQVGAASGAIVKNGLEMLIIQAEENWKIWNT
ncbi:MAG TPA: hypothetical protein VK498_09685, partial [Ferruginibacter sp.]|nr:hypothetical protein [Ferruginibacter sp.]